ncbi:RNA chaperone Hfq [Aneurinibacillus tyrosinisolvens]|uniref:RNA chaperone Hfq n=1 Tax=Aneurinibacillus tyrosinisolvens TaxID=1443435 RepID=UPI00063F15AA|nr:RNA chaperone Hfq [Aneurinibacillus tyrosinisolvens]
MEKQHKNENQQDTFLNTWRKEKQPVIVFTKNGFQLKGLITAFDMYVVALDTFGKQQIIYKHAISTVVPAPAFEKSAPKK